jgi:hypothetical protein
MQVPSAHSVLRTWETARSLSSAGRADVLVSLSNPELSSAALRDLSLGKRDGILLELRQLLFGPRLSAISACGQCAQPVQMDFRVAQILIPPMDQTKSEFVLTVGDIQCTFRLPTGWDMDAIADSPDAPSASRRLLERCLLKAIRAENVVDLKHLDDQVASAIGQEMARVDPQADIRLSLVCPACCHQWSAPFDPLTYLWRELDAWSIRILHEVHSLARKYGWREPDILAMTPLRRQLYLEMSDG